MTKANTKAEGNANNLAQIKVTRGVNAVASAVAQTLKLECGITTNRAELVQLVNEFPYPEELPAGTENIFNMASVYQCSPVYPEDAYHLGNYKVSEDWKIQKDEILEALEGHRWSRRCDRNNVINCSDRLSANSALVLGDVISGLRRALKVTGLQSFEITSKPNKVFSDVDWCVVNLFEVYAYDEQLAQGKAKYWTLYLNFKTGKGSCSSCGTISISELTNELENNLDSPSLDLGERSWEYERDDDDER